MEKALKVVYDIHRQALLESNQSANKFKALSERLTEKYKKLQKDHELLSLQNKHLQDAAFNKQTRGGDCCAALRTSLETIGTSYKQLIEEKDTRIKYLEGELKKYKRRSASLEIESIDFTQDTPFTSTRRAGQSSPVVKKDTSPDSTSRSVNTPNETGSHHIPNTVDRTGSVANYKSHDTGDQTGSQPHGNEDGEEDLVFVEKSETQSHQPKLRLQKGRLKRSRYTEDTSPEYKRQRQSSSPKSKVVESEQSRELAADNITSISKDNILPVLVPDTCQLNLDETLMNVDQIGAKIITKRAEKAEETDKKVRRNKEAKGSEELAVQVPGVEVVPETLAACTEIDDSHVDTDIIDEELDRCSERKGHHSSEDAAEKSMDLLSDTDESDSEISQCTVRERSKKITEISMRSVLKSSNSQRQNSQRNKSNLGSSVTNISIPTPERKYKQKSTDLGADKDESRVKNILDSPDSQSYHKESDDEETVKEFISHKTLNLSGDSEVFELDSISEHRDEHHNVNIEKKYSRVPDTRVEHITDISESVKPLQRKFRSKAAMEERFLGVRRSPRKQKDIQYYETPKKSKKKIKENSQLTESEIHEMFSSPTSGSNDEIDITVNPSSHSPTAAEDVEMNTNQGTEKQDNSQSVDCFNIVPVKDGVPVSKAKFQLKIPKNKRDYNEKNQKACSVKGLKVAKPQGDKEPITGDDLKSPSLITNKAAVSGRTEIVLSSQSAGSLSDPESPLLLQGKREKTPGNNRASTATVADKAWLKSGNKPAPPEVENRNVGNQIPLNKRMNSSTGLRKSSRVKPMKSLCQTTLTQSFLKSPGKKSERLKGKSREADSDLDLQEAIRLSLEEAHNSQPEDDQLNDADVEVLDFGTEKENSPPFKRPHNIPRSSLRRRNRPNNSSEYETVPSVAKNDMSVEPLREVSDNASLDDRVNSEGVGLNGSIDPAAELTVLCAETSTPQYLPSLDKDFQFEELNQGRLLPKTSTLAEEDSQEIASSSCSVKFGTKKKRKHLKTIKEPDDNNSSQEGRQPQPTSTFDTSFDHVPKKKSPEIKHEAVVRKHDERQKLKGYSCRECYDYYKSKGLSEDEIYRQIQDCSRHRAKHVKPDTPPHFWSVGFIDTQECVDRGYMKIENKEELEEKDVRTFRRRRALEKRFKGKNETSFIESDHSD